MMEMFIDEVIFIKILWYFGRFFGLMGYSNLKYMVFMVMEVRCFFNLVNLYLVMRKLWNGYFFIILIFIILNVIKMDDIIGDGNYFNKRGKGRNKSKFGKRNIILFLDLLYFIIMIFGFCEMIIGGF